HLAQILAAAGARKHVLVDKPFALTRAEAERAIGACRKAGVVVAAAHNRRFLPVYGALKRMVDAGELGTILHLEAHFSSPTAAAYRPGIWRALRAENPGGGMAAMGIHMVDALIGLGGPVARVVARSTRRALAIDVDDTTSMLLDFASGSTGYLATLAATASQWRLQVAGARGWAEARDHTRLEVRLTGEPRRTMEFDPFDSVRAELEAFAAAIEGRAPYPIADAEVVNGIAVFEACARSAETGQAIAIRA
ncbi:MAG: Gfo/Idh/MocA family oxidoreductase, partial [Alphaproteobacteria bacterium]|nr:Gfo/Idh/MocA family oxidoreductase [Alphaproteobacteria bacterium]